MSATTALIVVLVAWLAIGAAASIVMGRRGHHPATWAIFGSVFGPLVIPVVWQTIKREREAPDLTLASGTSANGGVAVLIGTDGSPCASAAAASAVALLGARVGRCALAFVIDYDTALEPSPYPERAHAEECLREEASKLRVSLGREPETVLLAGRPAEALRRHAAERGFDVLVVGSRGHGASRLLFGSVASALSRNAPVPVFIVTAETKCAPSESVASR